MWWQWSHFPRLMNNVDIMAWIVQSGRLKITQGEERERLRVLVCLDKKDTKTNCYEYIT